MFFNAQITYLTSMILTLGVLISLKSNLEATAWCNISPLGVTAVFRHGVTKTYLRL